MLSFLFPVFFPFLAAPDMPATITSMGAVAVSQPFGPVLQDDGHAGSAGGGDSHGHN